MRAGYADELTQSQIAERLPGRTREAVGNRASFLGLRSVRTQTVVAVAAKQLDAKARRARLEVILLEDAERLRAQVWQPHEYIDHGGKEFVEVRWTQPEPSPTDKLRLVQAATQAIDRSLRISTHDSDTGVAEAVGALDQIADALVALADGMTDMGPDQ